MFPLRYHPVRVLSRRREIDVLAKRAGIQEVSLHRLDSRLPLDVTSSLIVVIHLRYQKRLRITLYHELSLISDVEPALL